MAYEHISTIRENIESRIIGKADTIDLILCALLRRGHVLIEDVPGTGKTTLAQSLAQSLGCTFRRIQFTPDVMPSDITGFSLYDASAGQFTFRKGVIFNNVILADEINRTSPKTQSALLEVMQENQVTVEDATYCVPSPFMVLATQNPVEYVGTFPLPEAQLDRFFMRVSLGYPGIEDEVRILEGHDHAGETPPLGAVVSADDVLALQAEADEIYVSPALKRYIAELAEKSRTHPDILLGVSPRGAIALMNAAKGSAFIKKRVYTIPDDVQDMALPVLAHRLILKPEARLQSASAEKILSEIIAGTALPEA